MKALFYGIAAAALGGVMTGALLQPAFKSIGDRIEAAPPAQETALIVQPLASTSDAPWVLGTDALRSSQPVEPVAYDAYTYRYPQAWSEPEEPFAAPAPVEAAEVEPRRPAYPSEGGGVLLVDGGQDEAPPA